MENKDNNCKCDYFDFESFELPKGLWWNISYIIVILLFLLNLITFFII